MHFVSHTRGDPSAWLSRAGPRTTHCSHRTTYAKPGLQPECQRQHALPADEELVRPQQAARCLADEVRELALRCRGDKLGLLLCERVLPLCCGRHGFKSCVELTLTRCAYCNVTL